jgi:de-etiolated-1
MDKPVDNSTFLKPRSIPPQNIVNRLWRREIYGTLKPGTQFNVAREFHQNVFPNFTIVNVEKPPCFLRKFSPDGRYFIAFSSDQTSLEIYEYRGSSAAADLVEGLTGEYVGNRNDERSDEIRSKVFERFFKPKFTVNVAQSSEQLNRECSLFTDDGRYVIVGSAAYIPDDLRPHFYEIYTNNEAVTPNPRSPLEDYSLHLVDLQVKDLTWLGIKHI